MLRIVVLGFMGLLLAGFGVVAYVALQPPATAEQAQPAARLSILAAAREAHAGSLLQPADLGSIELEKTQVPAGAMEDTPDARAKLVGAMLRHGLSERDVILGEAVLRPGDRGFLAAVLAPDTRAVSVGVDAVSGAAGLIWPGDRVDVILTQTLDAPDLAAARRVAGETVLGDVRVIAVDQQLVQGGQAAGLLEGRNPASRTITLEVSPHDAERLAVATRLGKLQVVLRSARAAEPVPAVPVTTDGPRPDPAADRVKGALAGAVATGSAAAGAPVWGGDVSRALGVGAPDRGVEVRLFQGGRAVQAYRF